MASPTTDIASDPPKDDNKFIRETDESLLQKLGYAQQFKRVFNRLDSFLVSFACLIIFTNTRTIFFLCLPAGGPLALWTSSLIGLVFIPITAAVLREICSALPTSGSLYVWAAEAAGPKYGRFFAFIAAWWVTAAWMAFPAAGAQLGATYILSIPSLFRQGFPGGISNDNIKWRAAVWAVSELLLLVAVGISFVPPNRYSLVFRFTLVLILVDMLLNFIWLPLGASKAYGLRSREDALLSTYSGTGAPVGWSWMLALYYVFTTCAGFEASAHVSEETNHAKIVSADSVLASGVSVILCQFVATIIYLFCLPADEVVATFNAPQPFILVYKLAIGRGGAIFMALLSAVNYMFSVVGCIMAASRLVFAIARDGVLPAREWVQVLTLDKRPRNAVLVVYTYSALLLCTSLPSSVAFSSLLSIGSIPLAATYGLIGLLRLTLTPNGFRSTKYPLGYLAKPFYFMSAIFGAVMVAVLVSPMQFPVTGPNLNYTGAVFGGVTILALLSWWFMPEENWMRKDRIKEMYEAAD